MTDPLLDEFDDPESWDVPEDWTEDAAVEVADLAMATELSRKLRGVDRWLAELDARAEAELDRLQRRAVEVSARARRRRAWIVAQLEAYALDRRHRYGEKTTELMYAVVKTTECGGGWTADEDAIDWARFNAPELLATNPKLKIADAKNRPGWKVDGDRVLDVETGEFIPGITVAPKGVNVTVKVLPDGSGR